MDPNKLEQMIEKCLSELDKAYNGECDRDNAEKNAALFLQMQLRLADHVASADLKAKTTKNEVERLSAQKYFEYKKTSIEGEKKLTEAALDHAVNKDDAVFSVKNESAKHESEYKKWNFISNTLSNGHIYYRNLGKQEKY